jgi:hypothetical protein
MRDDKYLICSNDITLPLETVLWCSITEECLHYFSSIEEVRSFVRLLIHRAWSVPHVSTSSCVHLSPLPQDTTTLCFATSCKLELAQPPPFRWDGRNFRFQICEQPHDFNSKTRSWKLGKDANQLSLRQKKASPDLLLVPLSRSTIWYLLSLRELCGRKQLTFSRFVWLCDTETAASSFYTRMVSYLPASSQLGCVVPAMSSSSVMMSDVIHNWQKRVICEFLSRIPPD